MEVKKDCVLTITVLLSLATHSLACPSLCSCSGSRVDCYGKELAEIPEDLPPDVVYLDLQTNLIQTVGTQLQNLSSLEKVMLRFNKISVLSEGAFSFLPSLKQVNLGSNLITAIASGVFQNVPAMSILDLTDNQLTSIEGSFDNVPGLTKLVLTRNKVERLTENGLQSLTSLVYLMVDENELSNVSSTAFAAMTQLSYVSLSKNPLTTMDGVFSANIHLSYLDLSDCHLLTVPSGLPWPIRYLQLSKNNISRIFRDTFRETRYLGIIILDENQLTEVEPGAFSLIAHLEQIWLNGNQLTTFPSPIPSSVHTVSIEKNKITEVINTDFPENSKMTLLSLKGNEISAIEPFSFSRLTGLKKLYLGSNAITELRNTCFAGLRNLTALEISRNPLTHIEARFAAGLHALELLDLSFVEDTEPFVKGNFFRDVPYLQTLSLRSSPSLARHVMSSPETLKSFYHLQNLDLRDNHLQSLETDLPRFFPNLKTIQVSRNTWVCDTRLLWLQDWMQRQPDIFLEKDEVLCALPMHLAGTAIADLPYHAFFHTPTTTNTPPPTDDDFLGSGEVTTEYGNSSRSNFSASIADEGFLSVSTSAVSSTLKVKQPSSPTGDSGQVTQSPASTEDTSGRALTESSSDRNHTMSSKTTTSRSPVPTAGMSANTSVKPQTSTQSLPLPSKTDPGIPTVPSTATAHTKGSETSPESPQWSSPKAPVTSRRQTVRVNTSSTSLQSRTTGVVVTQSSTSTSVSTSMKSQPTTTTTTREVPTTKRSTIPPTSPDSQLNNSGQRSPSVKGQTSTNQQAAKKTTGSSRPLATSSITTRSTPFPTKPPPVKKTTPTNPLLPTTPTSNPPQQTNNIPRYGDSPNRMPSVTEASGPARSVVIAVSATIITLIVILIAVAFVLRHRRQIQLMYHRRFTYTIEHSDMAFVLGDQDDSDTLSQVMTPRYRSRSRSEEEETGSRSSAGKGEVEGSGRARDRDDGIAMFMWKDS